MKAIQRRFLTAVAADILASRVRLWSQG